jgi:hypothetical protein
MYRYKRILFAITFLVLASLAGTDVKAETLIWEATSHPQPPPFYFNFYSQARSIAVDGTGLYISGFYGNGNGSLQIEKRSPADGRLIWNRTYDFAGAIGLDLTGLYGIAGGNIGKVDKGSGSVIWTSTFNIAADAGPSTLAVAPSGLYAAGTVRNQSWGERGGYEWHVEARNPATGSVLWAVNDSSSIANYTTVEGIASDGAAIYVVGVVYPSFFNTSVSEWKMEARSQKDGSQLWAVTSDPANGTNVPWAVAADSSGVYFVGVDSGGWKGSIEWRIEKRSLESGALVWAVTEDPDQNATDVADSAYAVAASPSGLCVAGSVASGSEWRVESRNLADGSLVWNETVPKAESLRRSEAFAVAIDSSAVFAAGYQWTNSSSEWRIEKRELGILPQVSQTTMTTTATTYNPLGFAAVAIVILIGFGFYAFWRRKKSSR